MSWKRNRWKARTEGKKNPRIGLASKIGEGKGAYYRESAGNDIFAVTAYTHYNLQPGHWYPFFVLESVTAFYINFRNLRLTESVELSIVQASLFWKCYSIVYGKNIVSVFLK
jgi:hypothetical protein